MEGQKTGVGTGALSSLKNLAQCLSSASGIKITRDMRGAGASEKKQELMESLVAFFKQPANIYKYHRHGVALLYLFGSQFQAGAKILGE